MHLLSLFCLCSLQSALEAMERAFVRMRRHGDGHASRLAQRTTMVLLRQLPADDGDPTELALVLAKDLEQERG